jgi:hypothetical protein
MARKIVVYGNPDKTKKGFPRPEHLRKYLGGEVFTEEHGRYRYTKRLDADVIVMSRDGLAYGHLDIASKENPTVEDKRSYPPAKCVYIVSKSTLYEKPVRLSDLGITGIRFGKVLLEDQFKKILDLTGQPKEFGEVTLAEELPARTYPEGAASHIIVNAYERNPAALEVCKAHYGTRCQVCGLDMSERYGDIGKGFIHVHHLKQLSKVGAKYEVDPIADLRPVCPNCHAMLHRKTPPLTINELKLRMIR